MINRKMILFWAVVLLLFAGGCIPANIDELLVAPKLPGEDELLKQELDKIRSTGAVSAVPETGERQALKMIDLDADGVDEAIAFFRTEGGAYSMYVFRWQHDHYEQVGYEEGVGFSLRAVHLPQRSADGTRVIAVAWSLDESGTNYGVSIFGYDGQQIYSMLDIQTSFMQTEDINGDGASEFIFITWDPITERRSVNIYGLQGDSYIMQYAALLCNEASSVKNIQFGRTTGGEAALFIDSMTEGQNYVTDVINLSDRQAVNDTRDPASGEGSLTLRTASVFCQDIDGDGVIDVPSSVFITADSSDLMRNMLNWYNFSEGKIVGTVASTYHNINEEWHLVWPEQWDSEVRVRRSSSNYMTRTEFYILGDTIIDSEVYNPVNPVKLLLTVMVFSGDNKLEYFTQHATAKLLKNTDQSIYCFILPTEAVEGYSMTEEQARVLLNVDAN